MVLVCSFCCGFGAKESGMHWMQFVILHHFFNAPLTSAGLVCRYVQVHLGSQLESVSEAILFYSNHFTFDL